MVLSLSFVRFSWNKLFLLTIVLILLAGCRGNTNLVYASRTGSGIQITTATANTPTPSISIGHQTNDFALIPIAVTIKDANGNESKDLVWASSTSKDGESTNGALSKQDLKDYQTAVQLPVDDLASALGSNRKDVLQHCATIDHTTLVTTENGANLLLFESNPQTAKHIFEKNIKEFAASKKLSPPKQKMLTETINAITFKPLSEIIREDALSVFGSFNSNVVGGENVSQSLGQVFSTGIAAQNISSGIEKASIAEAKAKVAKAATECINAIQALSLSDEDKKIDLAQELCKAKSK